MRTCVSISESTAESLKGMKIGALVALALAEYLETEDGRIMLGVLASGKRAKVVVELSPDLEKRLRGCGNKSVLVDYALAKLIEGKGKGFMAAFRKGKGGIPLSGKTGKKTEGKSKIGSLLSEFD